MVADYRGEMIIREIDGVCLHITAKGSKFDCVTRTFAPQCNMAEDPICGRGHCHVILLWDKKPQKIDLLAYQASTRGGTLDYTYKGERTILRGYAALFAVSEINCNIWCA